MKKLFFVTFIGILAFIISGCPSPKPEQELNKAKEMLELAQKEEAPIYAKSEFDNALKDYQEATNFVSKGNNDEAKKKALTSITNSENSITKTRKAKAEQSLSKFDSLIQESDSLKMSIIYPENYNKFSEGYKLSKSLYESSNYYDSYTNSSSILPEIENKVNELKNKWNTAKTELSNVIARIEKLKRIAKWLTDDVMEIENLINEAKIALDKAYLDESIQKSKEANEKINSLYPKLKDLNQQQLEQTDKKIKELKINKINIIFLHFARKANIQEVSLKLQETKTKLALLYESQEIKSEVNTNNNQKDLKPMSDEDLNQYKSSLEDEISNLKNKVKTLYKEAEDDYNNGNYEDSLDKLEELNNLLNIYSIRQSELNKVSMEIEQRNKKKIVIETKSPISKTYTVNKGDFLSKIAGKLFKGEYWWWPKIFTSNKDKIKDPDIIDVGMELQIPDIK